MKVKTSNILPPALDWTVAKCEGKNWGLVESFLDYYDEGSMRYSSNWSLGGLIIEREKITISDALDQWAAGYRGTLSSFGPTPLVAAMRAYVTSKLGDEVEVPNEFA